MPQASGAIGLYAFFTSATGMRIAIDVVAIAAAGGLFVVPVFAAVQSWAGEDRRARVIAGVNIVTSLFIVGGSIADRALLQFAGMGEPALLALSACSTHRRRPAVLAASGNFAAEAPAIAFPLDLPRSR